MITLLHSIQIIDDGIVFEYDNQNAQSVFLVGSMNDWNTTSTPMKKNKDGVWSVFLKLDYGEYEYKFMVDGEWQVDQKNPNFQDDGYGGSNSVIQYGSNFNPNSLSGIKSSLNPKIYFKGRYFSNNIFFKNETARFMLDKPEHDFNFGIQIKFNSDFEGYTVLNVNNNKEGSEMWKTHFNYKRSYLNLKADYFNITAFDNFGLFLFDNPFNTLGDIGYNRYNFGYNFKGVYLETSKFLSDQIFSDIPLSVNAQILFSDRIGYNEDDVSASRLKFSFPAFFTSIVSLGTSNYEYITKPSDELIQSHKTVGFDFEYIKNLLKKNWTNSMEIKVLGEFLEYQNLNDNGVESIWMEGENLYLGTSIKFPKALELYANYINSSFDLGSDFSRDKFSIGFKYNLENFKWDINAQFWENNNLDNLTWEDYYKYVEKSDGNGRWFEEYSEVPFEKYTVLGYQTGFLWSSNIKYVFKVNNHKIETTLKNKFAHYGLLNEPKFIESIFVLDYYLSKNWKLKIDTRVPYYNDSFLGLSTDFSDDQDVFISTFSEISYHLSDDIWISFGYGVNPIVINSVTDNFYDRGREEYLESIGGFEDHLDSYYGALGDKIRIAEKSLMDEKRISVRAILEF